MRAIDQAYRRFGKTRFALPSDEQVAALERRIGVRLPADYRQFLLEYNGGYVNEPEIVPVEETCPRDALTCLWGIGATHPEAELGERSSLELFENNDPPQIVPIGHTPLGNVIILVTRQDEDRGTIFFKQAFGDFYHIADGIEEFFGLLRERADA